MRIVLVGCRSAGFFPSGSLGTVDVAPFDLGALSVLAQTVISDPADVVQEGCQLQKFGHGEGGTHGKGAEHIAEIPVVAERDRTLAEQVGECGFRLGLRVLNFKQTVQRQELPAQFFARLGVRVLLQTRDDFIKFYNVKYFFVHRAYLKKCT